MWQKCRAAQPLTNTLECIGGLPTELALRPSRTFLKHCKSTESSKAMNHSIGERWKRPRRGVGRVGEAERGGRPRGRRTTESSRRRAGPLRPARPGYPARSCTLSCRCSSALAAVAQGPDSALLPATCRVPAHAATSERANQDQSTPPPLLFLPRSLFLPLPLSFPVPFHLPTP